MEVNDVTQVLTFALISTALHVSLLILLISSKKNFQRFCSSSLLWSSGNVDDILMHVNNLTFSGPVTSRYLISLESLSSLNFKRTLHSSLTNVSYTFKYVVLCMASWILRSHISRSVNLSDILRKRCRVSIITCLVGMKGNNGGFCSCTDPYFFFQACFFLLSPQWLWHF